MDLAAKNYLVDTQWLADNLGAEALRVIECTSQLTNYFEESAASGLELETGRGLWETEHIPGSVFADLLHSLSDRSVANFMYAMPSAERFASVMSDLGVGDGTAVVLYDRGMNSWAARVWWMLRAFGFDNAAVLNGGFNRWVAEGRPVSSEPSSYPKARFEPRPRPELIASRQQVEAAISKSGSCLINALDPDEFAGRPPQRYARPGRIPKSVNVPFSVTVDLDTQVFPSDAELRKTFDAAGALSRDEVICYCGGGIAASTTAFLLTRLGVDHVSLYDGSLTEWTSDPTLPMEKG